MDAQTLVADVSESVRMSPQYQRDVVRHWEAFYLEAITTNEVWTRNQRLTALDTRSPQMLGFYFLAESILHNTDIEPAISLNECMEQALLMVDTEEVSPVEWTRLCISLQSIVTTAEKQLT